MENLWFKVIDSLKERVGQQNFDIWIKPIQFLSLDGEMIELEVPNRFFKEWINEHYSSQIKDVLSQLTDMPYHLQFRVRNEKTNGREAEPAPEIPVGLAVQPIFNPKYTFDNFVVGAGSQLANTA